MQKLEKLQFLLRFHNLITIFFTVFILIFLNDAEATQQNCTKHAKLDLFYLQDDTASFIDDVPALRKYLPQILADLTEAFPDSRYGAGLFSDSNRPTNVNQGQYCYKELFKLSNDYSPILQYVQTQFSPTKGDSQRAEDSLTSMTLAALDDKVGWRPYGRDPKDGRLVIPVIMVVTDALFQYTVPCLPGLKSVSGGPCPGWLPYNGKTTTLNYVCTTDDYVTLETAKNALAARKAIPLILSVRDTLDGWRLLLDHLSLGGVVAELASDSTNIIEAVTKSLDSIVCEAEIEAGLPPVDTEGEPTEPSGKEGGNNTPVIIGAASGGVLLAAAAGYGIWKATGTTSSPTIDSYFEEENAQVEEVDKDVMNIALEGDFA